MGVAIGSPWIISCRLVEFFQGVLLRWHNQFLGGGNSNIFYVHPYFGKWSNLTTLQETNISPKNGILKMIFLFLRWDMLIPWRVIFFRWVGSTTNSIRIFRTRRLTVGWHCRPWTSAPRKETSPAPGSGPSGWTKTWKFKRLFVSFFRYICMQINDSGTPKWMVKIMETPIKMDDLGVPPFKETPI